MKKVLITGITGMVGSHLADYILEHHPEVGIYGLKRWRSPMQNIEHIERELYLYDGDLRDLSSMLEIINKVKPDLIFHIAAQSYVLYSYSAPVDTLTTNVIGTANLLESIKILGINPRTLIVSSPEVYGEPDKKGLVMREDIPLKPVSPYAVSKVAEEMLAISYYQSYHLNTVVSRAFAHEAPRRGDVFAVSNFAKQIASIEKGIQEPVVKVGNLDSVRTYCDVRDIVRAYWLLLDKGKPGEVYNIAGNERMSLREVLHKLLALSSVSDETRIEVDPSRLRPKDITMQIADDSKFRKLTGWEPEISFSEETLPDILDYWRERV